MGGAKTPPSGDATPSAAEADTVQRESTLGGGFQGVEGVIRGGRGRFRRAVPTARILEWDHGAKDGQRYPRGYTLAVAPADTRTCRTLGEASGAACH